MGRKKLPSRTRRRGKDLTGLEKNWERTPAALANVDRDEAWGNEQERREGATVGFKSEGI